MTLPATARLLFGLALLLPLSGCGNLLANRNPASVTYVLRPAFVTAERSPTAEGSDTADGLSAAVVQLATVAASPGYATADILVTRPDRRLDVFAASRWPDELPRVVGDLALAALKGPGGLEAFEASAPVAATHTLRLDVRRFDAEYRTEGAAPIVHVALDAVLTRRSDRQVLSSFSSAVQIPAAGNRMSAIVAAFEQAADEALKTTALRTKKAIDSSRPRNTGATVGP